MSYDCDQMRALSYALQDTAALKEALKNFNGNICVLDDLAHACDRLAQALEKHNEIEAMKLGIGQNSKIRR